MILNLTTNEIVNNMFELGISNIHPERRIQLKEMYDKLGRGGVPAIVQLVEDEFSSIKAEMPELTKVKEVLVDFKYPFVYSLARALGECGWKVIAQNGPFGNFTTETAAA